MNQSRALVVYSLIQALALVLPLEIVPALRRGGSLRFLLQTPSRPLVLPLETLPRVRPELLAPPPPPPPNFSQHLHPPPPKPVSNGAHAQLRQVRRDDPDQRRRRRADDLRREPERLAQDNLYADDANLVKVRGSILVVVVRVVEEIRVLAVTLGLERALGRLGSRRDGRPRRWVVRRRRGRTPDVRHVLAAR